MITFLIVWTIVTVLIGVFFLQGLVKIPANPPHMGQLTIFGKRMPGRYLKEGWHWLPLRPFLYGFILVKVERITFTVTAERVRTNDRAESKVPVTLTFKPLPELLCNYINSRQEEGVKEQLAGKIQERIREWGMDPEGGPATWEELNQSQLEATSVLLTRIAKNSIAKIEGHAQNVPTWIWLRYYSKPRPRNILKNERHWAEKDWTRVKTVLAEIETQEGPAAITALGETVDKRREKILNLSMGIGTTELTDLGVVLERLNIGDIDVLGEVGKQAEQEAKEKMERNAEALEVRNILDRVEEFMAEPYHFSAEHALEAVLVNMKKIPKTIEEKKFNISSETLEALKEILPPTLENILALFTKKTKKGGTK